LDLDEFDYDLSNTILLGVYYLPNFRMCKIIIFPCAFPIGDYDPQTRVAPMLPKHATTVSVHNGHFSPSCET